MSTSAEFRPATALAAMHASRPTASRWLHRLPFDAIPVKTAWEKSTYADLAGMQVKGILRVNDYNTFAFGGSEDGTTAMVMKSANQAKTWVHNDQELGSVPETRIECMGGPNSYNLLLGGHNNHIYKGTGNGEWTIATDIIRPAGDERVVKTYWAIDFMTDDLVYQLAQYGVIGVELEDGTFEVWQTSDSGDTWTVATGVAGVPSYLAHAGEKFFMTTKNGKLQKSEDFGLTWTEVIALDGDSEGARVKFKDADNGIAFTEQSVYLTYDGGETWKKKMVIPPSIGGLASDDVAKWNDAAWVGDRIILVGDNALCYVSTNNGQKFEKYNVENVGNDNLGAVSYVLSSQRSAIFANGGNTYLKQDAATVSGYSAGRYDVENDTWTPLASLGELSDESAVSSWGISSNGDYVAAGAYMLNKTVNSINHHACVISGNNDIIDLGSKFDGINRPTRANAVSDDGSVVVGWQDNWGPWYAAVWTRGNDGQYTQHMMLKDENLTEDDVDFTSQQDMIDKLVGAARSVSADGKWIGGTGNSSYYAIHGAWLWNKEEGYTQITQESGAVADIASDGSVAVGWEGIGYNAWVWTKKDGTRYISRLIDNLGLDLGDFAIQSVYDMSPNGRYITGYGLRSDMQGYSYLIDLKALLTTSIEEKIADQVNVSVYPNPVADVLKIDMPYNASEVKTTLSLYNAQGQLVRSVNNASAAASIDVSNLTDGIYVLSVNAEGTKKSFKVVVKH